MDLKRKLAEQLTTTMFEHSFTGTQSFNKQLFDVVCLFTFEFRM